MLSCVEHGKSFISSGPGSLANSEDQSEVPFKVAFHQGLHYLLREK